MKPEYKMLIIIFAVAFSILFLFGLLSSGQTALDYLTEFSAGALGVLLAFNLDSFFEQNKNKKDKNDLLVDIRDELEEVRDKLTGQGNLHFPDIWKSAISSGQIRLLESEQVRKLAKIYREIQAIEYEAKLVRQHKENLETCDPILREHFTKRHKMLSAILVNNEKEMRTKIEDILEEKWWKNIKCQKKIS